MPWETLLTLSSATVRRYGRFLVADLPVPSLVISTSPRNGGQADHVRHLVNHQSCEGAGHQSRAHLMIDRGQEAYHDDVCAEIELPSEITVVMGTAANMHYAAIAAEEDAGIHVAAV